MNWLRFAAIESGVKNAREALAAFDPKGDLTATVHNWRVEGGTATESRERCQGHCQAICRRDVRSGLLVSFDLNGQRANWHAESAQPVDSTPLGDVWQR